MPFKGGRSVSFTVQWWEKGTDLKVKGASHQIWGDWVSPPRPGVTSFGGRHLFPYDAAMRQSHPTSDTSAADLKRLQDELLRARINRARRLTEDQRLSEAFDLTNTSLVRMHEGAMVELNTTDPALGWREVRRRLERLRRARERNVVPPVGPPANSQPVVR